MWMKRLVNLLLPAVGIALAILAKVVAVRVQSDGE